MRLHSLVAFLAFAVSAQNSLASMRYVEDMVRESVQRDFTDQHLQVDLRTLKFDSMPRTVGTMMAVESSVWGASHRGTELYRCTTKLYIKSSSVLVDMGSTCSADRY